MKKVLVVYHRADFDGIFSCCVVGKWLTENHLEYEVLGYDYSDKEVPDVRNWPEKYRMLVMVDVSFPPAVMSRLKSEMEQFRYEDHHEVSIRLSQGYGYSDLLGRRDISVAAVENTWLDLFPGQPMPDIIKFVGASDTWNMDRYNWETETVPVDLSLEATYGISYQNIFSAFETLLGYSHEEIRKQFMIPGRLIKTYNDKKNASFCKRYSFEVLVDNKYKAIAILSPEFSSSILGSRYADYDLFIIANRVSSEFYKVSLYRKDEPGSCDISCGEYCYKFGGGGHKNAASCIVGLDVFTNLIINNKF